MTITSLTPAPDISCTCILAPEPAPPDRVASSPTVNVCPSFVITAVDKDCATIKPIVISGSALLIPVTVAPVTKVPDIVSKLIITSIISVLPSWNFNMVSTIAVASFTLESEGSFVCVIVCVCGFVSVFVSVCVHTVTDMLMVQVYHHSLFSENYNKILHHMM